MSVEQDAWTRERDRIDRLRTGLQDVVSAARTAKQANQSIVVSELRNHAVHMLLEYINNGYITRLWNELEAPG